MLVAALRIREGGATKGRDLLDAKCREALALTCQLVVEVARIVGGHDEQRVRIGKRRGRLNSRDAVRAESLRESAQIASPRQRAQAGVRERHVDPRRADRAQRTAISAWQEFRLTTGDD